MSQRQSYTAKLLTRKKSSKKKKGGKRKRRKSSAKKDANKPKKPLSPYIKFSMATRARVAKENPSLGFGDIQKRVAVS